MNKIVIVFLPVMLSASLWSGMGTVQPDESAFVKQNFTSSQGGLAMTSDTDSCAAEYATAAALDKDAGYNDNTAEWRVAYDTAKNYVENCYPFFVANDNPFSIAFDGCQFMDTDRTRWGNFREWLKSVLWLNPTWYCVLSGAIAGTYQFWDSVCDGPDYNAMIAIDQYVIQSGRCSQINTQIAYGDSIYGTMRHAYWLDTLSILHNNDSADFPEDTTIPTIPQLGLQVLYGPPSDVNPSIPSQTGVGSLTASENPFTNETTVTFTLGKYAYVSFQLSDVLGHVVQGDFKGTVLSPGEHSFDIDGANLPSGTYFARVTTPVDGTRTVKLVKE